MKALLILLGLIGFLAGCEKHEGQDAKAPEPNGQVDDLAALYQAKLDEYERLSDPVTGWLTPDDCDGWLWSIGKAAAAPGVDAVDWELAEDPDHPGKLHRRDAARPCWTPEDGDQGSKSTWSGDMGKAALVYAWRKRVPELVERHIAYGEAHAVVGDGFPSWTMGEPKTSWRVVYKPALVGLSYTVRRALGGKDSPWRAIRDVYAPGLADFHAHLQVMGIELRGEIAEATGDAPQIPRPRLPRAAVGPAESDISAVMFDRLEEHAAREPENPYFAYVLGVYSGDLAPAVTLCLRPDMPRGSYVRCDAPERCALADWLYTCGSVLLRFGRLR